MCGEIVLLQERSEMLVRRGADALAFQAHDDSFARVSGQESVASLQNGVEVFGAR